MVSNHVTHPRSRMATAHAAVTPERRISVCFGMLLDTVDHAALIFSREGALLQETRAYQALAHCEQDSLVVRRTARSLVSGGPDAHPVADRRAGGRTGTASRLEFQTASARYSLRAVPLTISLTTEPAHLTIVLVGAVPLGRSAADVLRCRYGITAREAVVAELITDGLTAPKIAGELGISVHTVRRHHERLYRKLGVSSRVALAERVRLIERAVEASR